MPAQLIDGVALSQRLRQDLARRAQALRSAGRPAGLAVLLVGDDPASRVYVRNKVKACGEAGIHSVLEEWPADTSAETLKERIRALNADGAIHGILVQLPLPRHLNAQEIIETIAPQKDVDGLQVHSAGALVVGSPGLRPCTPLGIMAMLRDIGAELKGARAVVMGRSASVGKPMALLLLEADATVTLCHSRSGDVSGITRAADIIVVAVGRQNVLTADMVKPGAIVIDVGINRNAAGKLCGDVDFAGVSAVAGWITPVPGGVGPMTITMLLANTVTAAEARR